MDKLIVRESGNNVDLATLFSSERGFRAMTATIAFPSDARLTLYLITALNYELSAEGEATIRQIPGSRSEYMNEFELTWSDQAESSATLKLIHPEAPTAPFVINLRAGALKYHPGKLPVSHSDTAANPQPLTIRHS